MSLATKYRPKQFDEVLGQQVIIRILERQLAVKQFAHCYLFAGPSGDGKTTLARILAHEINKTQDAQGGWHSAEPIEIDGASNNGVDNIRAIIDSANVRALDGEYKIFIIDECHQITTAGWNAFLKCIEEPPRYTIFMFCTTDPQKLPATILNRVMRFNLMRVSCTDIEQRLSFICQAEHRSAVPQALHVIAQQAQGSVREGITKLERVLAYSDEVTLEAVQQVLGGGSLETFLTLTNALVDQRADEIIKLFDQLELRGQDCRAFMDQYLAFVLELHKFCVFQNLRVTDLPVEAEEDIKYATGVCPTPQESAQYFRHLIAQVLELQSMLKTSSNPRLTAVAFLLQEIK